MLPTVRRDAFHRRATVLKKEDGGRAPKRRTTSVLSNKHRSAPVGGRLCCRRISPLQWYKDFATRSPTRLSSESPAMFLAKSVLLQ